jgi:trk system potassium uptake protein TrkH
MLVLLLSILAGGCLGLTAGRGKLVRLLILLRLIQLALRRSAAPPRAVMRMRLGAERLERGSIVSALVVVGLWVRVIAVPRLAFLLDGHDPHERPPRGRLGDRSGRPQRPLR